MRRTRTLAVAVALSLALAAPVAADEIESNVTETLTIPATIAATVPASLAYELWPSELDPHRQKANLSLSDVATDNPDGLSVYVSATPLVAPHATIPVSDRYVSHNGFSMDWTLTEVPYGTASIADALVLSRADAFDSGSGTLEFFVRNATTPGTYSGTLTLTFATNP